MLAEAIVQFMAKAAPLFEGDLLEFAFEAKLGRDVVDEAKQFFVFAPQREFDFDFRAVPAPKAGGAARRAMLLQLIDRSHVRVGFKTNESSPWTFSRPFDTTSLFGDVAQIQLPEFVSAQGNQYEPGWGAGNYPRFQQFLIDYIHFRYGLAK